MDQSQTASKDASEKEIEALRKEIADLGKSQQTSEAAMTAFMTQKATEITKMKKELKILREAREVCKALHRHKLDEEEEDDDLNKTQTVIATVTKSPSDEANQAIAALTKSRDEVTKSRDEAIKSRDEAVLKLTEMEDSNKKLNETINALNKEIAALKEALIKNANTNPPPKPKSKSPPQIKKKLLKSLETGKTADCNKKPKNENSRIVKPKTVQEVRGTKIQKPQQSVKSVSVDKGESHSKSNLRRKRKFKDIGESNKAPTTRSEQLPAQKTKRAKMSGSSAASKSEKVGSSKGNQGKKKGNGKGKIAFWKCTNCGSTTRTVSGKKEPPKCKCGQRRSAKWERTNESKAGFNF